MAVSANLFGRRGALALAAGAFVLTACSDSTGPDDHGHGADVDAVVIEVLANGSGSVTVETDGTVTGSLTIHSGLASSIEARFVDHDGDEVHDIHDHAGEFQLSVTTPAGITFTRTGDFTGTLSSEAEGEYTIQVGLYHVDEEHIDWGPRSITVNAVSVIALRQ